RAQDPNDAMRELDGTAIEAYWRREHLAETILGALEARGVDLGALTVEALAPVGQFHSGGKPATDRRARLAAPAPGTPALDGGGGVGGRARTLAVEHGCRVTSIDLTESYVRAARMLTARLGLADRVSHDVGDALRLPFPDGGFDLVWTQNSGMNIADKAALYGGSHRVLRSGGPLALPEPMAGPGQPLGFPVTGGRAPARCFLR